MKPSAKQLIERLPQLASCSEVYHGMCRVMSDPRAGVSDYAQAISCDPNLVARLLQLANSAFFGYAGIVKTIQEAVIMIGVQPVRDLVVSTVVMDHFRGIESERVNMRAFWEHCLACGIASRILARHCKQKNQEQFFAAGLMHDLGRLVLFLKEPQLAVEIFNQYDITKKSMHLVEYEILGFNHAELGALLLQNWGLPDSLIDCVRHHHEPLRSLQDTMAASIVHIGDVLAHAMEFGNSGETHIPNLSSDAWASLKLGEDILCPSIQEIDCQYAAVVDVFVHWKGK